MKQWGGADNNSILCYVSHKSNKIYFNFKVREFFFNVINEEVIQELKSWLDKHFNEMESQNKKMLLVADWSRAKVSDCELFFPFLENLVKRSKGLSPTVWKRKYSDKTQKATPFLFISALETTSLPAAFLQQVISLHQRICLLQENSSLFMFPSISPSLETIFPKRHVLPQQLLEKLVKDNLELLALLLLEREDKSGYNVLKEIAQHFHCVLSQGTLYPLLYQLEKEKKITKQNGKGREVIYSLSKKTREELPSRKETLLRAHQHLASFFERGSGDVNK